MENVIEVPVSMAVYESLLAQSRVEGRSVTELVEEAWKTSETRGTAFARMGEAMAALRQEAEENGTSGMSAEEIGLARAEHLPGDPRRWSRWGGS